MKTRICVAFASALLLSTYTLFAADVPKPLKSRFVVGDPVWREIPVRDDLRILPEKCWQVAVSTILDNSFDIATMDKDSGYIRTTWNEGVVVLGGKLGVQSSDQHKAGHGPGRGRVADARQDPRAGYWRDRRG